MFGKFGEFGKTEKIIACILIISQFTMLLPARELGSDMRRGMVRLEHYLDRAEIERNAEKWEDIARAGLEAAMLEWESANLYLREQDGEAWEAERTRAAMAFGKEKETAYVRWASERVYAERARLEESGLGEALREAAKQWTYTGESGTGTRTVNLAEAGQAQAAWNAVAQEIVDRYMGLWEEQQGAAWPELEARISALDLDAAEKERLYREAGERYRAEALREYGRIAAAEGNQLLMEVLYDQGSLRKLSGEKAAGIIARELAKEAEAASEKSIRDLFQSLDALITAEDVEDIGIAGQDWLNNFRRAFETGLEKWTAAEEGFLAARAEWERDAERSYIESEEVWVQAYQELGLKQQEWETELLRKFDEGYKKWEESGKELELEISRARQDFLSAAEETRNTKGKLIGIQIDIYNKSRDMMNMANQGIIQWYEQWSGMYENVYTKWRTLNGGEEGPPNFTDLLKNGDINYLTGFKGENVKNIIPQYEQWKTIYLELISEGEPFNTRLWESGAELFDGDTGWISIAGKYRKHADEAVEELYKAAGIDVSRLSMTPGAIAPFQSFDGYLSELEREYLKAGAVLQYWEEELRIAAAVDEYARRNDSGLEGLGKTLAALEEAEAAYETAAAAYQDHLNRVMERSGEIGAANEALEKARAELENLRVLAEEARKEYNTVLAVLKGLQPETVEIQIADTAQRIGDIYQRTIKEEMDAYFWAVQNYGEVQKDAEIYAILSELEKPRDGWESSQSLKEKLEEIGELLAGKTGLYDKKNVRIYFSPELGYEKQLLEILLEEYRLVLAGEGDGKNGDTLEMGIQALWEEAEAWYAGELEKREAIKAYLLEEETGETALTGKTEQEQRSLLAGQLAGIRGELEIIEAGEWLDTLNTLASRIEAILAVEAGEDFAAALEEGLAGEGEDENIYLRAILEQERILETTAGTALAWAAYQAERRQRGLAGLERGEQIAAQYGTYQISAVNRTDRESRAQVEKAIAENRDTYRQAAGFGDISGYIGELREKAAGLNLAGQEALNQYIAGLMEYTAIREADIAGKDARQDQEKFKADYDEAARAWEIFNEWQYQMYTTESHLTSLGTEHITDLVETERQLFIVYAGDLILARLGPETLREAEDLSALENLIANDGSTGWTEIFLSLDEGLREKIYGKMIIRQEEYEQGEYTKAAWADLLQNYLETEQGEAINILKGRLEEERKKAQDAADKGTYAGYVNRELDEKELGWLDQLKGFTLDQERADNMLNTEQRDAVGTFLEGQSEESRYQRLSQVLGWYEDYFNETANWTYGAYEPAAGGPAQDQRRSELIEAAAAYGTAVNGEAAFISTLKEQIADLTMAKKGTDAMEAEALAAKGKLEEARKNWEAYSDGNYSKAIAAVQKSYAAYNEALDKADAAYAELKELRLLKREKQEIYDWAGSIYLKGFGETLDGGYGTPKEKLSTAQYARERAQVSAEVLEGLVKGIIQPDKAYTGTMKEYKETSEKYYLGLAAAFEAGEAINRQKDIVRKAEFEAEAAYAVLVYENEKAALENIDLVSLSKAGNEYQVSLGYTIQNGRAVRTGSPENNPAVYTDYFKNDKVQVDTVDGYREYSKAAAEARVWVEKILQDPEYLKNIMLAALYLNTLRQGNGRDLWFGDSGDPQTDSTYFIPDAPVGTFHGVDIVSAYRGSRMMVLMGAWESIANRGAQGEKDLAYYLLFRDRNLLIGGAEREKELLESLSAGHAAALLESEAETKRGIAIGAQVTAAAATVAAIATSIFGGISATFWALAAVSQIIAINNFDAKNQLEKAADRVRAFINWKQGEVAASVAENNEKRETLIEKKEILRQEQEKLYVMMYGITEKPKTGDGYTVSYDKFKKASDLLFPRGTDQQAVSYKEVLKLYNESFYGEARVSESEGILDAIGKLNSAYEKQEKDKKEKLALAALDLQQNQRAAAEAYEKSVSAELVISAKNQRRLKELARLAGDPGLSVGERTAAAAAYDRLMAEIRPAPETVKAQFQTLAAKAWGDGTWNSELHDLELIRHEGSLLHSRIGYSRAAEPYTKRAEQDLAAVLTEAVTNWSVSGLEVKEKEWELLRKDYEKQFKAWIAQAYDIEDIALREWQKAREKLNEGYNKWRQNFTREYEAKSNGWEVNYLSFAMAKQEWVEDQYIYAANVGNADVYEQLGMETETAIGKAIYDLNMERMNREDMDIERYVTELLAETDLVGLMNYSGSITDRGKNSGIKVQQGSRRSAETAGFTAAEKVLAGMNEDLRKGAAKLAASQAQKMLRDLMARYEGRLREENKGMEEWERRLVGESGYSTDGQYSREVVIDATLFGDKTEWQNVHKYEYFYESAPELKADLSAGNLEGLDAEVIMLLIAQTEQDLRAWGEKIFGRTDEEGKIIAHTILRGTGDLGAEGYAAADQRKVQTVSGLLEKQAKNTLTDEEKKELARYTDVRDGLFGAHVGYAPIMKREGIDYKKGARENMDTAGAGQIGLIMLDFQWNSMKAMKGWAELAKPAHDKNFWFEDNPFNLKPFTLRGVVDMGMNITETLTGALGIGLLDDILFGVLDVTGDYKSMEEVGIELGKKTAMWMVNVAANALFFGTNGFSGLLENTISKRLGNTVTAGLANTVGKTLLTGVQVLTTGTVNSAISAIQWDSRTGQLGWSKDVFNAGFQSVAVGALSGMAATATAGFLGAVSPTNGFNSLQKNDMSKMNRFVGSMAGAGVTYGMTGNVTFNPVKAAGTGLFEITVGKDGFSTQFGTNGVDISLGTMASALRGTVDLGVSIGAEAAARRDSMSEAATSLRSLWGFGDAEGKGLLGSILSGNAKIKAGTGPENARTMMDENGNLLVYLNGYHNGMSLEEQLFMGITLQHEAYRNGIKTADNNLETQRAALGHTEMAIRMLQDGQQIGFNQNLVKDLLAYLGANGDANKFNAYVDDNYDSSADFWKLVKDANGNWNWIDDKSPDFDISEALNDKEFKKKLENYAISMLLNDSASIDGLNYGVISNARMTSGLMNTLVNIITPFNSENRDSFYSGSIEKLYYNQEHTTVLVGKNEKLISIWDIDSSNKVASRLPKQTEFTSKPNLKNFGCNFMGTIAVPQMLVGEALSKEVIIKIWDEAIEKKFMKDNGTVISQNKLADLALRELGRTDIGLTFGKGWDDPGKRPVAYRVELPYNAQDHHFVLFGKDQSLVYNPGNTFSDIYLGFREISVYAK
ncbi:hypothetical protein AGMMS49587_10960 [Spirochaetia bacterium]|nr:hypothetical protein AGMMS49587_10960 [Spirochaetia bacterium]